MGQLVRVLRSGTRTGGCISGAKRIVYLAAAGCGAAGSLLAISQF